MQYELHPDVRAQWARNVAHHRKEGGYPKQKDFADAIGVGQATVCRWENGTIRISDADKVRIATLLSVELDVLFPLSRATGLVAA